MSKVTFEAMEGTNRRVTDAVLDPQTGYHIGMTGLEHDIHEGNAWEMTVEALGLTITQTILIQLSTGDNDVHIRSAHYWTDAALARMEILSGVTLTTGTTPIVPVNRIQSPDHIKAKPTDLLIFSDPTGISGGDEMERDLFGGGAAAGNASRSGSGAVGDEFILAKNTDNLIRLTNLEAAARNFLLSVFFYLNEE